MEKLFIKQTDDTPEVIFDNEKGVFTISGRSLPENAVAFYLPLIEWLDNLIYADKNEMIFNIKLEYFNTASTKQITKVLLSLQKLAETKQVAVKWHYYTEDYDIKSSGARFAKLIKANIELVPYSD